MLAIKGRKAYGFGAALGVAAGLFLVWVNLAVGIIGTEGDPANRMYLGVLAVGVIGALVARFRPEGMAMALFAMAAAQALVAMVTLALGLGMPWSPPLEIIGVNGMFIVLFVCAGVLFLKAR